MADIRFEATREFVRRWTDIKHGVHAPLRSAVDPRRIAAFLPRVFMVSAIEGQWAFSLAGTEFYDLYGGELTGAPMSRMWGENGYRVLRASLQDAAHSCRPLLVHSLATTQDDEAFAETVMLPLRSHADFAEVDRFIGLQTFGRGDTWWAGSRAVTGMYSVSASLITDEEAAWDMHRRGRETPVLAGIRGRPSMVVYQGGATA
jgi:hypothetical protein|nr:PAS domain-containing protein [Neorhizobium tomejilense]